MSNPDSPDLDNPRDEGTPEGFWTTAPHGWRLGNVALDGDGAPSLVELVHEDGRALRLVPQAVAARAVATMAEHPLGRMLGAAVGEILLAARDGGTTRDLAERVKATRARKTGAALAFAADAAWARVERLKDAEAVEIVGLRPAREKRLPRRLPK